MASRTILPVGGPTPSPTGAEGPLEAARADVLLHAKKIWETGLVVASAGNVSRRVDGSSLLAITPASIPYDVMTVDQISIVDLSTGLPEGHGLRPSTELPMHLAVYRARPDVGAILHTHARSVSTLAILRRPLPPVIDEMIVYFGGTIEVADYAFTGTAELGSNVVRALGDRAGVMLANHGNVCVGRDLSSAFQVAVTMESAARVYVDALRIGDPVVLPGSALAAGRAMYEKRRGY